MSKHSPLHLSLAVFLILFNTYLSPIADALLFVLKKNFRKSDPPPFPTLPNCSHYDSLKMNDNS